MNYINECMTKISLLACNLNNIIVYMYVLSNTLMVLRISIYPCVSEKSDYDLPDYSILILDYIVVVWFCVTARETVYYRYMYRRYLWYMYYIHVRA